MLNKFVAPPETSNIIGELIYLGESFRVSWLAILLIRIHLLSKFKGVEAEGVKGVEGINFCLCRNALIFNLQYAVSIAPL